MSNAKHTSDALGILGLDGSPLDVVFDVMPGGNDDVPASPASAGWSIMDTDIRTNVFVKDVQDGDPETLSDDQGDGTLGFGDSGGFLDSLGDTFVFLPMDKGVGFAPGPLPGLDWDGVDVTGTGITGNREPYPVEPEPVEPTPETPVEPLADVTGSGHVLPVVPVPDPPAPAEPEPAPLDIPRGGVAPLPPSEIMDLDPPPNGLNVIMDGDPLPGETSEIMDFDPAPTGLSVIMDGDPGPGDVSDVPDLDLMNMLMSGADDFLI